MSIVALKEIQQSIVEARRAGTLSVCVCVYKRCGACRKSEYGDGFVFSWSLRVREMCRSVILQGKLLFFVGLIGTGTLCLGY